MDFIAFDMDPDILGHSLHRMMWGTPCLIKQCTCKSILGMIVLKIEDRSLPILRSTKTQKKHTWRSAETDLAKAINFRALHKNSKFAPTGTQINHFSKIKLTLSDLGMVGLILSHVSSSTLLFWVNSKWAVQWRWAAGLSTKTWWTCRLLAWRRETVLVEIYDKLPVFELASALVHCTQSGLPAFTE